MLELDLKTSLTAVADLAMPRVCAVCGRTLLLQERHICIPCLADLPVTYFSRIRNNPMADSFNALVQRRIDSAGTGFEPYCHAAALFYYRSGSGYENITQSLKYHRNFAAGKFFAGMLGKELADSSLFGGVDLVVPVPLHWTRRWKRGYNQAAVIAREVALELGAEACCRFLVRTRRTRSQAHVGIEGKAANVDGAFKVRNPGSGKIPSHVLLVDDVYTTGSTLEACHNAIRGAFGPAVRISIATLAYVER